MVEESKGENSVTKPCQMVDHHYGDLISLPAIDTITEIYSLSNIDSSSMVLLPDLKKKISTINRSQSMYTVLSFLRRSQVIQLQIVSKRFYDLIIPNFLNNIDIPQPPQFIMIDNDQKQVLTYFVDEKLNQKNEWTVKPL